MIFQFIIRNRYLVFVPIAGTELLKPLESPVIKMSFYVNEVTFRKHLRMGAKLQGSQVSMRVARGSASWLSSHERGLGPRDALKKDSRGLPRGEAGNPRFPRILPGTLGNFPGCL